MKITILAGGTGSIALQQGLYNHIEKHTGPLGIKVLVNAYDAGLSTGLVRKVFGGQILGPSDVRKNQTTRFSLEHAGNKTLAPLLTLLEKRISVPTSAAQLTCVNMIDEAFNQMQDNPSGDRHRATLIRAVEFYFSASLASAIDYDDFAVANIIYAGLAAQNGNSLRTAARIMAAILHIPDNVILNDDRSLYLGAITKSGYHIYDEGDIVSWNNPEDPITSCVFTDPETRLTTKPTLCKEAQDAIAQSDVIIISSGTQWSSLIPTYESVGFKEAIQSFIDKGGRLFLVMNRVPDKDAPATGANQLLANISQFFPKGSIEVLCEETNTIMDDVLRFDDSVPACVKKVYGFTTDDNPVIGLRAKPGAPKHSPYDLANAFLNALWSHIPNDARFIFDYDDTIAGRGNTFSAASEYNIKTIFGNNVDGRYTVCTGNSIKAVKIPAAIVNQIAYEYSDVPSKTVVYAEGGVNRYIINMATFKSEGPHRNGCIFPGAKFANLGIDVDYITQLLTQIGIPSYKIEERGGVMIAIKPIDPEYRDLIAKALPLMFNALGDATQLSELVVKSTGRTTIEIHHRWLSKATAIAHEATGPENIVYVGDEITNGGNDSPVLEVARKNPKVTWVQVKSPVDTAILLLALNNRKS